MWLGARRFLLAFFIIGAAVCLYLGITEPAIKLTTLMFWSTEHSLISTVDKLMAEGQLFLGLVVLVFSIAFPILKLLYLLTLATLSAEEIRGHYWRLRTIEWLGKWSMHDVLVLALMIFFIKSQGVYDATSLAGVYYFTAAIVLMILAYAYLPDAAKPAGHGALGSERAVAEGRRGAAKPRPAGAAVADGYDAGRIPPARHAGESPDARLAVRFGPLSTIVLVILILLAAISFSLGVFMPVIRFQAAYMWSEEHSILSIIQALYANDELFLSGLLAVVSLAFPFLKQLYLLALLMWPDTSAQAQHVEGRAVTAIEWLGRFSMTDVMVLALIIFYVNSAGYTEAAVQPGAYFYAASTLITMLAYGWANSAAVPRAISHPEEHHVAA
ncbi:MAG: paraquat-inducible protein A [Hyphomicrobiaceae bacterium]|nr:paraquat-inducible protein A [Hyphomicrobiaceae bacterium]